MESEAADLRDGFLDLAIVYFQVVIKLVLVDSATWNFNCNRTFSRFDCGLFRQGVFAKCQSRRSSSPSIQWKESLVSYRAGKYLSRLGISTPSDDQF